MTAGRSPATPQRHIGAASEFIREQSCGRLVVTSGNGPFFLSTVAFAGESLIGVLMRCLVLNQRKISSTRRFAAAVANAANESRLSPYELECLRAAEALWTAANAVPDPNGRQPASEGVAEINGLRVRTAQVDPLLRRVSPLALRISPRHRAHWTMTVPSYCLETREVLLRSCPVCSKSLSWVNCRGVARCGSCVDDAGLATDLRDHVQPVVEPRDPKAMDFVCGLLSPSRSGREAARRMVPVELSGLADGELWDLALQLRCWARKVETPSLTVFRYAGADGKGSLNPGELETAARMVLDWPLSFDAIYECHRIRRRESAAVSRRLTYHFSEITSDSHARGAAQYAILKERMAANQRRDREQGLLDLGRGVRAAKIDEINITDAARCLGTDFHTALGYLKGLRSRPSQRWVSRETMVPVDDFLSVKAMLDRSVGLDELCGRVGIPLRHGVWAARLLDVGVALTPQRTFRGTVSASELDGLLEQVNRQTSGCRNLPDGPASLWDVTSVFPDRHFAVVLGVRAIAEGRIQGTSTVGASMAVSLVVCSEIATKTIAADWLASIAEVDDVARFRTLEASYMLVCSGEILRQFVKADRVKLASDAYPQNNPKVFTFDELTAFRREFATFYECRLLLLAAGHHRPDLASKDVTSSQHFGGRRVARRSAINAVVSDWQRTIGI